MADALDAVAGWPVVTAGIGVVRGDGTRATAGDLDRALPWASVTKLLTAVAVLVAVEEETVALDDEAGPPGSTVRHLLAHASGLPFEGDRPVGRPGRKRVYSNTGYEVVAAVVAERAEMPFGDYLRTAVLDPLAMGSTTVTGSPASGALGPVADLLLLAAELLAPTLVSAATWELATTVAFPGLAGVVSGFGRQASNDWGLGPELRDHKSPHWTGSTNSPRTFGHFGRAGGFLWVDPEAGDGGVACACLTDRDFDRWAKAAWPALSDAVLTEFG